MSEEHIPPRFKDGKSGISHDRILMRLVNYTQIIGWVVGFIWGGIQIVRKLDEVEQKLLQIPIMQQQVSALQQMVVHMPNRKRRNDGETN